MTQPTTDRTDIDNGEHHGGPSEFFDHHRDIYAASIAASAATTAMFAFRAVRARSLSRKVGWTILAMLEGGIVAGLASLRYGWDD